MTISFVNVGSFQAAGASDPVPGMPASWAAGDLLVLCVTTKYDTATITTPSGWTLRCTATGGTGTSGNDTGTLKSHIYTREAQTGDTAPTVAAGATDNVTAAQIVALRKTTGSWGYGADSGGGDTTSSNPVSCTGASETFSTGNWMVVNFGIPGDLQTVSSRSFSISGGSAAGTYTNRASNTTSAGTDMRLDIGTVDITAGGTGAPTMDLTMSASQTGVCTFLRVYEDTGGATQNITGAGNIATAEAFGSPTVSATYDISAAGNIASAEAFGTAVVAGPVTATGIASAEAFGTPTVTTTYDITAAGNIASAEAFGTATVTQGPVTISPTAIDSAEAFGSATVTTTYTITGTGIASAEAFGTATVSSLATISPSGIASAEAFGTATVTPGAVTVSPSAIASAEAFGTATVSQPGGVTIGHVNDFTSTDNVGSYTTGAFTPTANDLLVVFVRAQATIATDTTLTASANGLTFHKAGEVQADLGNAILVAFVANQLVPSSPASMTLTFDCSSDPATGCLVTTLYARGMQKTGSTAVKQYGEDENNAAGATPEVILGATPVSTNPLVGAAANNANPAALTPPSGFTERSDTGHATPDVGLETASIDSGHGSATVTWGAASATRSAAIVIELDASASAPQTVSPSSIASAEAFGTATVTSLATISPTGIATAEAFGTAVVTTGPVTVSPTGISSAEAFGTPSIAYDQTVTVTGIGSAEAFGTPIVSGQVSQTVTVYSTLSQEAFGTPTVHFPQTITVDDILPPDPQFGQPTVSRQVFILVQNRVAENSPPYYHIVDRVDNHVGKTLYKIGSTWYEGTNLSPSVQTDASIIYWGGVENIIDDAAIRAELAGLGYTFITRTVSP